MKLELNGRQFENIMEIQPEAWAVLESITKQSFGDSFSSGRDAGPGV
jgi:hypothetical protein